jgi:hypothetical protein
VLRPPVPEVQRRDNPRSEDIGPDGDFIPRRGELDRREVDEVAREVHATEAAVITIVIVIIIVVVIIRKCYMILDRRI